LSDGTTEGNRAAFFLIGTFMAGWIILYGAGAGGGAAAARAARRPQAELIAAARGWALALALVPARWLAAAIARRRPRILAHHAAGGGIALVFGFVFAVNSSLHSYLILAFTRAERVTMDVGFYYMANAGGRLMGTLLSGLTYQIGGLP
jgi:hypothetical protein